jgi:hypothetical protein
LVAGLTYYPTLSWEQEGFALALSFDGTRYEGLWLPSDNGEFGQIADSVLIVQPAAALAQREAEGELTEGDGGITTRTGTAAGSEPAPGGGTGTGIVTVQEPKHDYYFGAKELDSTHYALDFKKILDEVILHLAGVSGATLRVRVEIEAEAPGGFSEFHVRTVSENSATLKFDQGGFEKGHHTQG